MAANKNFSSLLSPPPTRAEALSLLWSLLRIASKFNDFSDAKAQLEVAKRQAVVYSLYAPKVKRIMELKKL
ncbi:hypothetical protein LUZ61_020165 [Rhynchospora tenuis]|uniref:Uncharacterized protein n=1 Tax=Rhynchospora tenuis TaxID=198213 RepID=A0AAD5ZCG4_9POAL|nr:hypothetical protein LUZ61_020165 [Rhynchospora tenuis]